MARPQKEGIDYFSVDCQFSDEEKLIIAEFGLKGAGTLYGLKAKIYGGKGFYTIWDNDVALLFARDYSAGIDVVKEVVSACIRRGIFDRDMFERYGILTSKDIQERYADATERRVSQKIDGRYLLIPIPSNWIIDDNNSVNVDNNGQKVDKNTQSKVEYSKGDNSKVNHSFTTTTTAGAPARKNNKGEPPTLTQAFVYFKNELCVDNADQEAEAFTAYNATRGWSCLPNWKAAANLWAVRINQHQ